MFADRVEDVLVACAEDDVRPDLGGRVVDAGGDLPGVRLAAADRLAAGHVPLAVVHGPRLLTDVAALGGLALAHQEVLDRDLAATGVRDDVGAVAVGRHDHAGGPGGGGGGGRRQVRQRADQDRGVADGLAEPLLVQHLTVRGDDHPGAGPVLLGVARADAERPGRVLGGAQLAGLPDRVGPGTSQ